jgi:diadenosine tetraphosphate (Ap4A) HIT family hydrolase
MFRRKEPAHSGLGARVEEILRLAEDQATGLVDAARSEADEIRSAARADAAALRDGGTAVAGEWPHNWEDLVRGTGCPMCASGRPESDDYGVRIRESEHTDAYLQRADIQPGYTLVIWRGRHVTEPTELSDAEAHAYWDDVLTVARSLMSYYKPLKMNYETLGNGVPHLHTHLIPRFAADPAPGRPFPLSSLDSSESRIPGERLMAEATALRDLLASGIDPAART